jgi:hypothetical protein
MDVMARVNSAGFTRLALVSELPRKGAGKSAEKTKRN